MSGATDRIEAAGGVVRRLDPDGTPRVLLIHRDRYDDWCFPKGKREGDETPKQTAAREVTEETGVLVDLESKLEPTTYQFNGREKVVRYWLMNYVGDAPDLKDDEVDAMRWCTVEEAEALLTYEHDRPLLDALRPTTRPGHVWLIRHAKAGSRTTFDGPDADRPLTPPGLVQATELATAFRDKPIARVISSPYARCVQTVAPLAAALSAPVETDDALGEGHGTAAIHAWCAQPEPVALCTHSDLIEALLWELVGTAAIEPEQAELLAKGSTWHLRTQGGVITSASYHPPVEG